MDSNEDARIPPDTPQQKNPSTTFGGPPPRQKAGRNGKAPRWTIAFLRSLERTGSAEEAAEDAGIDRTTAYHRRRAHADFAAAWNEALKRGDGCAEKAVRERVGFWEKVRGKVTPRLLAASADGPVRERERRKDELLASTSLGGKMVRAGHGRWNAAAEERFFNELAATANVKRACAAAGVSTNAVYARRLKRPDFRAKWDAVLETGRAAIEMHLVEAAKKSFDPEDLDVGDVQPKVSVTEALRIVQLHGTKTQRQEAQHIEPPEEELEAVRQRLFDKLQRLRKREMPRMIAQGWSLDEATEAMVPPGWVKDSPAK
jgi:hypothetical protein